MAASSEIPGVGSTVEGRPSRSSRLRPGRAAVGVRVHDQLGAALQRAVRDGVHVPDDHVGLVAGGTSASAPPSTPIRTGLKSPMYGPTIWRSRFVSALARDHERVPVAEARLAAAASARPRRGAPSLRAGGEGCSRRSSRAPRSPGCAARRAPSASSSAARSRPAASREPLRKRLEPRTTSGSPSFTSSKSSAPGASIRQTPPSHERERAGVRVGRRSRRAKR